MRASSWAPVIGQAGAAGETRRPSVLHQDTLHLDAGAYASTGGDGAGKIGDMGRPLRVKPATERAGAALHASSGVAADRPTAGAERLRALRAELAVSPQRLEVKRSHGERLLRSRVERVEVGRPLDALPLTPLLEHLGGGAEAGAGVDHRGAADGATDGNGDRGLSRRDRHATVAVEQGEPVERIGGIAGVVHVRTRTRAPAHRGRPPPGAQQPPRHPPRSRRSRRHNPRPHRAAPDRPVPWRPAGRRLRPHSATRSRLLSAPGHHGPSPPSRAASRAAAGRGRSRSASPPSSPCSPRAPGRSCD